jgi:hypothetical protein
MFTTALKDIVFAQTKLFCVIFSAFICRIGVHGAAYNVPTLMLWRSKCNQPKKKRWNKNFWEKQKGATISPIEHI